MKLRQSVQQQVENAVQLLETDLRGLWPQLHDMIDQQLAGDLKTQVPRALPDFARQRRELLQSIQLTLSERVSGKTVEEQLAQLFHETSARLRVPASVAAAGGIAAVIAAMTSAAAAGALFLRVGRGLLNQWLLELPSCDNEVVVFSVAPPGARGHIAHLDKLPVRYVRRRKPKVIANGWRNI